MTSKVLLKKSSVEGKVPLVGDLDYGEVALNYTDGKLFYKKSDNTIQSLISAGGGAGGGAVVTAFTSQTSVVVTHNLGAYPVVAIIDNSGAVLIPLSIIHSSVNAFTVAFSVSTTGNIIATLGIVSGGASGFEQHFLLMGG